MDLYIDLSGVQIDKYHVLQKIGNGSFGSVYRVYDKALQSEKAIKILDADQPTKALDLLKEAVIPYKYQHKNIVTVNEANVFLVQGEPKVVIDMELVNGGSLESKMQNQHISIIDSLKLLSDVLYGLEFAHINGVLHRDVKPANILIHNGIPKLSDFGLAVPIGSKIDNTWMWYSTHIAPEIIADSTATNRSDIFAFGMTMYRVVNSISDWRSFTQKLTNFTVLLKSGKLIHKLPFEPIVPNKVRRIIKKACKPNPDDRYQTAAELRNEIDKLQPTCRWQPVSDVEWEGKLYRENSTLTAGVNSSTKSRFEFRVLKNKRTITAHTRSFYTIEEALSCMHCFISANTVK